MFHQPEFKKEVVQFLLQHGIQKTLEKYKLPKSTIYYWVYKLNQKTNHYGFNYSKARIDPRLIIFIEKVYDQFPSMTRKKIKQLCDQYSFINNASYISISSIGRIVKRLSGKINK